MLKSITAYNFRNLNLEINLGNKGNLLVAKNGSGKTNFLEIVNLLSVNNTLAPILNWQDLVGSNGNEAKISVTTNEWECALTISNGKKTYTLNGKKTTAAKIQSKILQITFCPVNVDLIAGSPSIRRADLDQFLSHLFNEYKQTLKSYNLVLRNRNALLKHIGLGNGKVSDLEYWTNLLAKQGAILHNYRGQFFKDVKQFVARAGNDCYTKPDSELSANYISKFSNNYEAQILQKFSENIDKELAVGQTLYGVHKDDYELCLNNKALKYMGSRGEQRLGIFVWKLAQYYMLKNISALDVTLLIDDLSSELDTDHRLKTAQVLLELDTQFIYTSADTRDVPEILKQQCQEITI